MSPGQRPDRITLKLAAQVPREEPVPNRSFVLVTTAIGSAAACLINWGISLGFLPIQLSPAGSTVQFIMALGWILERFVAVRKINHEQQHGRGDSAAAPRPGKDRGKTPADHPHGSNTSEP